MLTIPDENFAKAYEFMKPMLKDDESKGFQMHAQYMFKDIPETGKQDDYIAYTLERMDATYDSPLGRSVPLKERPSAYFKRQCWVSADPDERSLSGVITAFHPL